MIIWLVRTVWVQTDLCADLILISEVNLIGRGGIVQLDWSWVSDSNVVGSNPLRTTLESGTLDQSTLSYIVTAFCFNFLKILEVRTGWVYRLADVRTLLILYFVLEKNLIKY